MLCNVPECRKVANSTWALVPICSAHRETIRSEHRYYYQQSARAEKSRRDTYHQIYHLTIWGRLEEQRGKATGPVLSD